MLLTQVKKQIVSRLKLDVEPPNDEDLTQYLVEGLYYVSMKTEPIELLCKDEGDYGEKVLRYLDNGYFIKVPEVPDFSKPKRHLQIDEGLTYAVIYYVCFLVSGDEKFRFLQDEFMQLHQQSLRMNFLGDDND